MDILPYMEAHDEMDVCRPTIIYTNFNLSAQNKISSWRNLYIVVI